MARKSSITRLPSEQREFLDKLTRDGRHTLDEIIALAKAKFPGGDLPSRSALGRYTKNFNELAGRMRDIREMGQVFVSEFGEDTNDRAGQLLVEAVTTFTTDIALKANNPDKELSIKEAGMLARAARNVMDARKVSLAERQAIAKSIRERAAEEAEAIARDDGVSEATINKIRERVLGVAPNGQCARHSRPS